jgi:hypothetical protein
MDRNRLKTAIFLLLVALQIFMVGAIVFVLSLTQEAKLPNFSESNGQIAAQLKIIRSQDILLGKQQQDVILSHCLIVQDAFTSCATENQTLLSNAKQVYWIFVLFIGICVALQIIMYLLDRKSKGKGKLIESDSIDV